MVRSVLLPNRHDGVSSFARTAEALGYHRLWTGELWGRDAFVALTRAGCETEELSLGTAIANVYGRSAATLAQAAATLERETETSVALGLGTSTQKAIEDLHGEAFDNPPRRLHETAALTRRFLHDNERVAYEGDLFSVADFPGLDTDIPVYAAALGAATRRATGRTADGWIPHNIPFEHLNEAFETVANAATEADRDPDTISVAPYVPAAASENPAAAIDRVRAHIAYYVGSGAGYRRAVAAHFPDEATSVAESWRNGDRAAAREAVTDEMVNALGVAGDPEEARRQLAEVEAIDVIDEAIVVVPTGTDDEMTETTVEALAP